jgi:hypothetical protein
MGESQVEMIENFLNSAEDETNDMSGARNPTQMQAFGGGVTPWRKG